MARFFPMLSSALRCNKVLNQFLIQHINKLNCFLKRVQINLSEENHKSKTLSNKHVFGKVENCADSPSVEEEFHHRLKIITFKLEECNYEIGFFESGYQLAVSIPGETNIMEENLEKYNNGNTEELIKFYPNIEFLLCLIDRMKVESQTLSKLQLEVLLMLFQQLRLDTFEEFKHVRMSVEHWFEMNNENESELLFSNLGTEKWHNSQLLSHAFFSLAFSDIMVNIKQYLVKYSIAFASANNNPRYFNILLSAIYGNELSLSAWAYARKCYLIETFSNEILSVLDDIGITPESNGSEYTFFPNYPNCLLDTINIEQSQFMDPRSVCYVVKNREFNKSNFNKHSFSNYILSDYFIVQYLVRKSFTCETMKEREEYLQELKQIDMSAYFCAKCDKESASLNRLSFAQLSIQHGLDTCYLNWGNYKKFQKEEAIKVKKMVDHLLGFDSDFDKLRVN